jgi:ribosomal protein S18 acetylase RimI-like enzyme
MKLFGKRLYLKKLDPDFDDLDSYLSWLRDIHSNRFIESAREDYSRQELVKYISEKNTSDKALLLGIFENQTSTLIGTIKLEPIDLEMKTGWVGILIGNFKYRGKGYGYESLDTLLSFSSSVLKLQNIYLGVSPNNFPALKLYEKLGFLPIADKKNALYLNIEHYKSKL